MTFSSSPAGPRSVVLAAGGTAGHLEPALAVADELRRRDAEVAVTVLGTAKGLESRLVPARGYDLRLIEPVPLPRSLSRATLSLPARLRRAVGGARRVLVDVDADVVVGFGGYAALPAYLAARRLRCPIVVHEANARPGLANRVGARLTRYVAVSFADTGLAHERLVGVPLRPQIAALDRLALRDPARAELGLTRDRPVLLVFGGSQGAQRINDAVAGAARRLLDSGCQVLHAAGPSNTVVVDTRPGDPRYVVVPYLDRMDLAYAAADLVLCRSGAMTCTEVAAVGLPAVFVPYPFSNGEQELNARPLVDRGAAILVDDSDLTAEWVGSTIPTLISDDRALARMGRAAKQASGPDAAGLLVDLIDEAAAAGASR
ncbi:MAG: undecaprenyldiphospho-muramoylpentapeptide beta-N-acetylglucosaminyltransferase [Actinomycetes bacterium]